MENLFLREIYEELANATDVNFPTCFAVTFKIRQALNNINSDLNEIATLISLEPLLTSKVLRLANSALYGNRTVTKLSEAVTICGSKIISSLALTAAYQHTINKLAHNDHFKTLSQQLWSYTIDMAAICCVLTEISYDVDFDTAFLMGMVHELPWFYLLAKVSDSDRFKEESLNMVSARYAHIAKLLFWLLEIPSDIYFAILTPNPTRHSIPATSLTSILSLAKLLVGSENPFQKYLIDPQNNKYDLLESQKRLYTEINSAYADFGAAKDRILKILFN